MQRSKGELRFRIGCPLALIVTAILVAGIEWLVFKRPLRADAGTIMMILFVGLPFGILALARARDSLAWLMAIGLTGALWAYIFYADQHSTNFMWGLGIIFMPVAITGASLAFAGMRGRIVWALEDADIDKGG